MPSKHISLKDKLLTDIEQLEKCLWNFKLDIPNCGNQYNEKTNYILDNLIANIEDDIDDLKYYVKVKMKNTKKHKQHKKQYHRQH